MSPQQNTHAGAAIGKGMTVKGEIRTREDLFIDGDVEGTIDAEQHVLTVGPDGRVKARIKAREVVIAGRVTGNIEAVDRISIRKEAHLTGDIRTAGIRIDEGAYFKGSIDIVRPESSNGRPEAPAAGPSKQS
ncbi:MAG: polymer-forming cytoskeletal protein [Bryobacterales bacterium]|nr:polymer-forming cytoskeletal protein [Bryobacterales bacterium]